MAPGILNGQLTIWARDKTSGIIYVYPIYLSSSNIPTLNPNPSAPGTPIAATSGMTNLGITLKFGAYPDVATNGDANSPSGLALYAIDSSGNVYIYPGTASGNPSTTATNSNAPVSRRFARGRSRAFAHRTPRPRVLRRRRASARGTADGRPCGTASRRPR